jgi:hypothetical protein
MLGGKGEPRPFQPEASSYQLLYNILCMKNLPLLILLSLLIGHAAQAQVKAFSFQERKIKPGTRQSFLLPVITATDSTFIPVTIFHGTKEGPVLGITAGVHGLEYAPIMAAQALTKNLDPNPNERNGYAGAGGHRAWFSEPEPARKPLGW